MNLQKSAIACCKNIIVVRFQGDGSGKSAGNIDKDKRGAPAGDIVNHFNSVEESLAGRCGKNADTGGGCCPGSSDHRMFGFQGNHAASHLIPINPLGYGFSDLGLGCDGESRDIINVCQTCRPCGCPVTG